MEASHLEMEPVKTGTTQNANPSTLSETRMEANHSQESRNIEYITGIRAQSITAGCVPPKPSYRPVVATNNGKLIVFVYACGWSILKFPLLARHLSVSQMTWEGSAKVAGSWNRIC
jgi:hypothetical protein